MDKREQVRKQLKENLEKQHYGFAGNNTAVKICTWTKKSLKDEGVCYKEKFYGIRCHRCLQMAPTVGFCPNQCIFCWRDMELTLGVDDKNGEWDEPEELVDKCIEQQRKLLSGFYGNDKVNEDKIEEAQEPKHFAISLTGEPTIYPYLNQFIKKLHERSVSTFVVSNGQFPERIKNIEPPTQLYLSVDAADKETLMKVDRPAFIDAWERFAKSLEALKELKGRTRTTLRVTLIKGINMKEPEKFAEIIKLADPDFVEVKAYMFVGSSRLRLSLENMPRHYEVKEFAEEIAKRSGYQVVDESEPSRVVLLMKEDFDGRVMKF